MEQTERAIICHCGSGREFKKCCENAGSKNNQSMPMSMQDMWILQYKQRRYLEYVSKEDLIIRTNDIFTNMTVLKDDLRIGLHPFEEAGRYWAVMWSDVLTECELRGYIFPDPFAHRIREAQIPKFDLPGLSDALKTFRSRGIKEDTYWVKFGEYKFLKDALEKGSLRIAPASSYSESHLNKAQRDAELELLSISLGSEVTVQTIDSKTGKPDGSIKPLRNVEYRLSSPSNYHTCCLTMTFDHRLFGDFNADCALIIKDRKEFLRRILSAFKEKLASYKRFAGPITYFDPLNSRATNFPVCFSKHFRFAYQKEYRIVWFPLSSADILKPVFVEMGSLEDICEMICLPKEDS